MQHSDVPELALPHAFPRPVHWLATATAIACVVALSSLVQPGHATAVQPKDGKAATAAPAERPAPDPAAVSFPLDCGDIAEPVVARQAAGDLDGDGSPETVAAVHCDSAMGTPPDAVYVLTRAGDTGTARLVATLVEPEERHTVTGLAVRDGQVEATVLGYSSAKVPSCCPDVEEDVNWRWADGAFHRGSPDDTEQV
ncbi:hypothetical protein [Streptomyces abyssomicinicus]|uniref:hypothetical protein n=1 Tax=Streptomyces abyssomicinicus TaxID=574929 RepID=UPI00125047A0|nr:hypothetical protein [Streptomyces abyssomicinicus]